MHKAGKCRTVRLHKHDSKRHAVGVIGGDTACLRAVVRHWTGCAPSTVTKRSTQVVRLTSTDNRRDIVLLFKPMPHLNPWPGGPLIWLFPERGPSEPELAEMRMTLNACAAAGVRLRIVLCLPSELDPSAASDDLDIISDTLQYSVPPDVAFSIEAVWLSGTHRKSLVAWLAKLK